METKTQDALTWIVGILTKHGVRYRIGGGFAASLYGSPRPVSDIDIAIHDTDISRILPDIKEYITYGPARYKDEKWDCMLVTLVYKGQEIDISGADTLRMSTRDGSSWISLNDRRFWDTVRFSVSGLEIEVMNPEALLEYKGERDPNTIDTDAIQKYISENRTSKNKWST